MSRRRSLLVALLSLVLSSAAGAGFAADPPERGDARVAPDVEQALQRFREQRAALQAKRALPEQRERRERSRTAYRGKAPAEARQLALDRFEDFLVMPETALEALLPPGGEVESVTSDHQVLVREGDGKRRIVVAEGLPLTSDVGGAEAPVDLDLVRRDDKFVAENPVKPFEIESSGEFRLGAAGIAAVVSRGATETELTAPQVTNGRLFFADYLPDTDLVLSPTPLGVEVALQVRSADAPEAALIELDLPAGARLRKTAPAGVGLGLDAPDAIEVVRGGEVVAAVLPPAAWDADGKELEVRYALAGSRIRVSFAHRDQDLHYPLLVDPTVTQSYGNGSWGGWSFVNTNPGGLNWGSYTSDVWAGYRRTWNSAGGWFNGNTEGKSSIYPSGGYTITSAGFSGITHQPNNMVMCGRVGTSDQVQTYCGAWSNTSFTAAGTNASNHAIISLIANGGGNRAQSAIFYVLQSSLTITDTRAPSISGTSESSNMSPQGGPHGGWRNSSSFTHYWTASDEGSGVRYLYLQGKSPDTPSSGYALRAVQDRGCADAYPAQCGSSWSGVGLTQATIPEGVSEMFVQTRDAHGHYGTPYYFTVKFDRSAPTISAPSGTINQGGLVASAQDVTYTFNDSRSGLDWTRLLVDGSGTDSDDASLSCGGGAECATKSKTRTFTFNPAGRADGQHTIRAEAKDGLNPAGLGTPFNVLVDNTAPSTPSRSHSPALPSGWTEGTFSTSTSASDQGSAPAGDWGTGITKYELLDGADVIATRTYTCDTTIANRCSKDPAHVFEYSGAQTPPVDATQLDQGLRTLSIQAHDGAGRTTTSPTWQLKVDRTAPSLDLTGALWEAADGVVEPGEYAVAAEASDSHSGAKSIDIKVDGQSVVPAGELDQPCPDGGCPASRDWEFDTGDFDPGEHTITVIAKDQLDHVTQAQFTIEVDAVAPTLNLQHSNQPPVGWADSFQEDLTASAADSGTGVAEIEVSRPGEEPVSFAHGCLQGNNNNCPATLQHVFALANFPEGATTVSVVARDGAGNESAASTFTVRIDTADPVVDDLEILNIGEDSSLHGEAKVHLRVTDAGSGIAGVTALIDGVETAPGAGALAKECVDETCREATATAVVRSDQLAAGPHLLQFEIRDVDDKVTVAPDPRIAFDVDARPYNAGLPAVAGEAHFGETVTAAPGEWRGTGSISYTRQWQRCHWIEQTCEDIPGATDPSYQLGTAELGKRIRLEVVATNSAGSAKAQSFARQVPLDSGPVVHIDTQSPATSQNWVGPQDWPVIVKAADPGAATGSGIEAVELQLDGQPVAPGAECQLVVPEDSCPEETTFPLTLASAAEGPHALEASVTDKQDEATTLTKTVHLDKTSPTLALSGSLSTAPGGSLAAGSHLLAVEALDGQAGLSQQAGVARVEVHVDDVLVAKWDQSCALGNCGMVQLFTYDTAQFGPGRHEVEVVASDLVGNDATSVFVVDSACDVDTPAVTTVEDPIPLEDARQAIETHHAAVVEESATVEQGDATYAPTLLDAGPVLAAAETPTRVEVPKTSLGSTVVGNGVTASCLVPTTTAAADAVVVNGDSALYANTAQDADTVVRPVLDGIETFTSIRSADAPESVSWTLAAGDATLEERADGSVELVDQTPPAFDVPGGEIPLTSAWQLDAAKQDDAALPNTAVSNPGASDAALNAAPEAGLLADASASDIAEADATSPGGTPGPEEEPQGDEPTTPLEEALAPGLEEVEEDLEAETQAEVQQASQQAAAQVATLNGAAVAQQQAVLPNLVVAEVENPVSHDADQDLVPTALDAAGQTLTLQVDHLGSGAEYPIAADPWVRQSQTERRVGTRKVYRSELRRTGTRKVWEEVGVWWCAYWVDRLNGRRRSDGLYEVQANGKTYRIENKTQCMIEVLAYRPIVEWVPVLTYQPYYYWANVDIEVWQEDDDETIAGPAVHRPVKYGDDTQPAANAEFNQPYPCPNDPNAEDGYCGRGEIHAQLNTMIEGTVGVPGHDPTTPCTTRQDEILITVHSISDPEVMTNLENAARRCVDVKVLQNGAKPEIPSTTGLGDAIGPVGGENYRRCTQGDGACISTAAGGVMHAKFALFSKVTLTPSTGDVTYTDVSWVSSANLTKSDNKKFNNSISFFNFPSLYTQWKTKLWDPMWAAGHPKAKNRGHFPPSGGWLQTTAPDISAQASPLPANYEGDPVQRKLKRVGTSGCVIKMVQMDIGDRRDVIDELTKRVSGGCRLDVIVGDGTNKFNPYAKRQWTKLNTELQAQKEAPRVNVWTAPRLHDKLIIARWGAKGSELVITGSQNLTRHAIDLHDEIQIYARDESTDPGLHEAYNFHWKKIKKNPDAECVVMAARDCGSSS
jgi:hypothetical protein